MDWFVKLEGNKIKEIKFSGHGCAISKASTSMTSEVVDGKSLKEVLNIQNQEIFDMLGIELSVLRVKCALLGIKALQKSIVEHESNA